MIRQPGSRKGPRHLKSDSGGLQAPNPKLQANPGGILDCKVPLIGTISLHTTAWLMHFILNRRWMKCRSSSGSRKQRLGAVTIKLKASASSLLSFRPLNPVCKAAWGSVPTEGMGEPLPCTVYSRAGAAGPWECEA